MLKKTVAETVRGHARTNDPMVSRQGGVGPCASAHQAKVEKMAVSLK